jgi:23S rRNA pseudouridine955/2504/2580 synthase
MITVKINAIDHCRSMEAMLHKLLPGANSSYIGKMVKSGHVTLNGEKSEGEMVLRLDDEIAIKESGKVRSLLSAKKPNLDLLYEDQWIMAFNKEAGLPVHRAAEVDDRNLVDMGRVFLASRGIEGKLRPVNRLDRGTSGVIIMAKSPTAAGMFGRMVKEEGLGKLYLAVAEGCLPDEGSINIPLEGKESETRYRLLYRGGHSSFVAAYPVTGRMHQIRQHFSLCGHPILGDRRYGGPLLPGFIGMPLHSFRTRFNHPESGRTLEIFAPLPEQFLSLLKNLTGEAYLQILRSLPDLQ